MCKLFLVSTNIFSNDYFDSRFVDKPQTRRLGYSGRLDNLLLRLRIFKSIHTSESCNIYECSGCNISNSYDCCRLDFVLCHSSSQNPHFFNCLLHPCKLICFEFAKLLNRDEIKTYVYPCKQYIYSGADPGLYSTLS